MDGQHKFPSCIVVMIVNMIVHVFSKTKCPAKDVAKKERERCALLVLHIFHRQKGPRGSFPYYTSGNDGLLICRTATHDLTPWIEILLNETLLENFDCL
jgi:hypothetical protein